MTDEPAEEQPVDAGEIPAEGDNDGDDQTVQGDGTNDTGEPGDDTDTGCEPGNAGNAAVTTTETVTSGEQPVVIDLRPDEESVKSELVRLGLVYDRTDTNTGAEIWRDYARHLAAEFPSQTGEPVKMTDLRTGISRQLDIDHLRTVSRIIVSGETF